MDNPTPMLRQYLDIKKQYPGTLLFFRLGDFYELFNEDAQIGARELQITLTARHKDSPNPVPMCGVPYHAAAGYISKLVRKGYRVAICEQAEAASKGVKLVKREVVRVITPGTAVDSQLVERTESSYLAAVTGDDNRVGVSFLELSTGEFSATEETGPEAWAKVAEHLGRYAPSEILLPRSPDARFRHNLGLPTPEGLGLLNVQPNDHSSAPIAGVVTPIDDECFASDTATKTLCDHFDVKDLSVFGLAGRAHAISAAAACMRYVQDTQKAQAAHIQSLDYFESAEFMVLDAVTLANLEIIRSRNDSSDNSLFSLIDETITGMGGRLLRAWLLRPSIKRSEIQTRLAAVNELGDAMLRDKIRLILKSVADLERLIGRLNLGTASPRDLVALKASLDQSPVISESIIGSKALLLQVLAENIFELPEVRDLIARAIVDEPPQNLADGGVIRSGYDSDLDELREMTASVKQAIAGFEAQERERTGIQNLKIRFNNVFGYFIEISKSNLSRVPDDYDRRQTLTNAERFTTAQLKEWEAKVLGAEEKMAVLESDLYRSVVDTVAGETRKIQSTARALATVDTLCSLAETAAKRNFICPQLHDGDEIEIRSGRHPVVEASIRDSFVPNDIYLNNSTDRLLIVTGANMGGKSTVLRQIAVIQILAQIGSFVPAASARLPIVDRVWTRVGASDDLASGRSTFMVEMTETATILRNANPRSLILLDEIGRGTSTFDGLSIAWAVAEFLHNSPERSAKTVFATHYHELTELAESLPGAKTYQMTATERDGDVVFLHKFQPGKASKSYGIAVAKLAGLPPEVIARAEAVLQKLEKYELAVFADEKKDGLSLAAAKAATAQVSLFAVSNETTLAEVRDVDPAGMSADELRSFVQHLKQRII